MMKKTTIVLLIVLTVFCWGCGDNSASSETERFSSSFLDLFDTASTVVAYDTSQQAFNQHMEEFHQMLEEYNQLYDIYNTYEGVVNLAVLNQTAKDGPVQVDERIIDLLEYCRYAYELSQGKTNVCYGTVLSLWHDSREFSLNTPEEAYLPSMEDLAQAALHTDFDDLVIDKENSTVYFKDPQLQLDVGAVAKGYAAQQVCTFAKENLWSAAAISIGGNVCTFGYKNNDGKTLWNIGIESPNPEAEDYLVNVNITDLAIVTSGDYQRYYTVDGKKYCHIIDPETMMPAEYVSSVSVICADSALGDALSTALFSMSIQEGKKLISDMDNVEAVWVDKDYQITYSDGFEKYIVNGE